MIEFARLPLDERTSYLQEVANRRGWRLVPAEHRLAGLKSDYQQMQEMFT